MTSTGIEHPSAGSIHSIEKYDETPMARGVDDEVTGTYSPGDDDSLKPVFDNTHRKLKPRHIQLIGIGGYVTKGRRYIQKDYAEWRCRCRTIGTALYVQIGHSLLNGGPASLFMAFTIW